jgi:hypothetical protein
MTTGVLFGRVVAFLDVRTGMMVRRDVHFISGFDASWPAPFEAISISFNGPAS